MPILAAAYLENDALAYPPRFYVRENWTDAWIPLPEARLISASLASAAHGDAKLSFLTEYGATSEQWETTYAVRGARDLRGWWVRVDLVGPQGAVTEWVGKVFGETRVIEGASVTRSGRQTWSAEGALTLLDRVEIFRSWLMGSSDEPIELDWMPSVNRFDEQGTVIGNRSEVVDEDEVYLYGTQGIWTHRQYVDYVLKKYAEEPDGPTWTLTGQTEILDALETVIELEPVERLGDLLRKLISPRYGVDFVVRNVEGEETAGFELEVFALLGEEISFAGQTLPRNPRTTRYQPGVYKWQTKTEVERSDLERYHTLRIVGKRTVICCSLLGEDCELAGAGPITATWEPALQTEYEAAGGPGAGYTPEEHDKIRTAPRFEGVFLEWATPQPWENRDGIEIRCVGGSKPTGEVDLSAASPPYQNVFAATLPWTPLRKAMDYSVEPATESVPAGRHSEFLAPMVFVSNLPGTLTDPMYARSDSVGIGVAPLETDFGLKLHCAPNHLVAKDVASLTQPSAVAPFFRPGWMAITFAFECDQRPIARVHDDSDEEDYPMRGIKTIYLEEFEHWILAPNTVVGIDSNCQLQRSGSLARVLRDDHEMVAAVMAGAISRYQKPRARARITAEGLIPWGGFLGSILSAIEEAGDTQEIQAPFTSIAWSADDGGTQTTVIETGFAGSEVQT